jgi:hypothetical protein
MAHRFPFDGPIALTATIFEMVALAASAVWTPDPGDGTY